jgi:hypothetical protein
MNTVRRIERLGRKAVVLGSRPANTGTVLRMRCVMVGCLSLGMLAAACAPSSVHSPSPSPTPGQGSAGSPSPTPAAGTTTAATPVGTPGIGAGYQGSGDGAEFPAQDAPLASLSEQEQAAWTPYTGNTPAAGNVPLVVPGLEVFGEEPPLPTINQPLPAGLSAADAQVLLVEFWKGSALQAWALDHADTGMLDQIDPGWDGQYSSYDTQNVSQGADVSEPACDWYPTAVTIVAAGSISAWLAQGKGSVVGPYAVVAQFPATQSCEVTITQPGGATSTVNASGPAYNVVFAVSDQTGPPLGDYARVDDAASCQASAAVARYCASL